jgi:hypothetical protein
MRNRFSGTCACGANVGVGEGYFQRQAGRWITRCIPCTAAGRQAKGLSLSDAQRAALQPGAA